MAQKLMRRPHRANAAVERSDEVLHRAAGVHRVGSDGLDGREHVLDAMIELGNQPALLLLHPLAFGYIDADADDTMRASSAVIGNKAACLDPSHFVPTTKDSVLDLVFAPVFTERQPAKLSYPTYVLGVHASQAFAACFLDRAFREAVEGRIARRNLHDLSVGVIRVAADARRLFGHCELNGALGQCLLSLFALSNVDLYPCPSYRLSSFVIRDEDTRLDPSHLVVTEYPKFQNVLSCAAGERAASDGVQRREI